MKSGQALYKYGANVSLLAFHKSMNKKELNITFSFAKNRYFWSVIYTPFYFSNLLTFNHMEHLTSHNLQINFYSKFLKTMKTFKAFGLTLLLAFAISFTSGAQCPPASSSYVHIVQKGESLWGISKKYYMTVDEVARMNRIDPMSTLSICQELIISNAYFQEGNGATNTGNNNSDTVNRPGSGAAVVPQGKEEHTVRRGESISAIAYAYGYTEERFRRFNGLGQFEDVRPGTLLRTSDCICPDNNYGPDVTDNDDDRLPDTETLPYNPPVRQGGTSGRSSSSRNSFEEDPFGEEDPYAGPTRYNYNERRTTGNNGGTTNNRTQPSNSNRTIGSNAGNGGGFRLADEQLAQERARRNAQRNNRNSSNNSNAGGTGVTSDAARYMTTEEIEMVKEINLVRSNPAGYIKYIEEYKQRVAEGRAFGSVATCNELIDELRKTPLLSVLSPTPCIYNAAKKHGKDQRPTGDVDHVGTDGSYPWDRVRRECPNMSDGNENLVAGPSSIRDCVILLLVDEGIPNRGHRRTMLKPDWKYAACYKVGKVGNMPNNWVQKYGQ